MTKQLMLLLSLLLLQACTSPVELPRLDPHATVAIDPNLSAESLEPVLAGLEGWKQATGGRVDFSPEVTTDQTADLIIQVGDLPEGLSGQTAYNDTPMRIVIDRQFFAADGSLKHNQQDWLQFTMLHELGHALGLHGHVEGTLMRGDGTFGGLKVDSRTLAKWEQL